MRTGEIIMKPGTQLSLSEMGHRFGAEHSYHHDKDKNM